MVRLNRRQMLATVGSTLTIGLAGCGSPSDGGDGGDGGGTENPTETMGGMTETETETATETETETESGMMDGDVANVRAAHMSPDAPNVDVYVDGEAALTDVPFRAVSDYLELPTGAHQVTITQAGNMDNAVFDQELTLEAADYTLVASGELDADTFEVLTLADDNSDPGGDTSRLRAVHVSPDAGPVDVTVSAGPVLFDGVPFKASGYTTAEANDYTVQIRPDTDGNDGDVVYDADVSLNGGTVYTAFASGYLSPDDEPADEAFELTVVQDASY